MRWLVVFLALSLLLIWRYGDRIAAYDLESASQEPVITLPQHPGELVAGRTVEQELDWSRLKPWALDRYGENTLCIAPFFAAYGNRPNRGSLDVTISTPDRSAQARLDMSAPRDNRFYPVCFDALSLEEVAGQNAVLTIRGVDGLLGSSVTTWLTSAHGGLPARVDGASAEHGLVYDVKVQVGNPRERWGAWVLVGLTALILTALARAVVQRGKP
jgi:hypothetical protein